MSIRMIQYILFSYQLISLSRIPFFLPPCQLPGSFLMFEYCLIFLLLFLWSPTVLGPMWQQIRSPNRSPHPSQAFGCEFTLPPNPLQLSGVSVLGDRTAALPPSLPLHILLDSEVSGSMVNRASRWLFTPISLIFLPKISLDVDVSQIRHISFFRK